MNNTYADDLRRFHAECASLLQKGRDLFVYYSGQKEAQVVLPALQSAQDAVAGVLPENTGEDVQMIDPASTGPVNLSPSPIPPVIGETPALVPPPPAPETTPSIEEETPPQEPEIVVESAG